MIYLLLQDHASVLVFDQDANLPFPCPAPDYCKEAFKFGRVVLPKEHELRFRVVTSKNFLRHFSSDRSHMVRKPGLGGGAAAEQWIAEPPDWPLIQGELVDLTAGAVPVPAAVRPGGNGETRHYLPLFWDIITAGGRYWRS